MPPPSRPEPAEADIEIAEQAAPRQAARPFLDRVELAGRIAAADHRADRGAGDDVGHVALGEQRADDADMRKAARRAAAQHEPDARPRRRRSASAWLPVDRLIAVLSATPQKMKHANQILLHRRDDSPRGAARQSIRAYGENVQRQLLDANAWNKVPGLAGLGGLRRRAASATLVGRRMVKLSVSTE